MRGRGFGWSLPPGVSISDIPGNRPEDDDLERYAHRVEEKLQEDYETALIALNDLHDKGVEGLPGVMEYMEAVSKGVEEDRPYFRSDGDIEKFKWDILFERLGEGNQDAFDEVAKAIGVWAEEEERARQENAMYEQMAKDYQESERILKRYEEMEEE